MKKVILYTTKTCSYCNTAKEFLSQNKIYYIEKDINIDIYAQSELAGRNIRGVPTFQIGDEFVVGLDKGKVLSLVDHKVVECNQCHVNLRVPITQGTVKVTCPKCKNVFDWTP
ncbi:MAG: glutaredoxin domain-containing protein [Eubacteriales bacterium]